MTKMSHPMDSGAYDSQLKVKLGILIKILAMPHPNNWMWYVLLMAWQLNSKSYNNRRNNIKDGQIFLVLLKSCFQLLHRQQERIFGCIQSTSEEWTKISYHID
jgi:hypothetical protein